MEAKVLHPDARFRLTLFSYPDELAIPSVCKILYGNTDKNLIATLSTTPYAVGRSFEHAEAEHIHKELERLDVPHHFVDAEDASHLIFEYKSQAASTKKSPAVPPKKEVKFLTPLKDAATTAPTSTPSSFAGKRMWTSKKWTARSLGLFASVMCIGGALLYFRSSHPSSGPSTGFPVDADAHLVAMEKSVELKRARDLLWKKADLLSPLQFRDSVRTGESSSALIEYREGSRLRVRENTLVVISETPVERPEHRQIQLENGEVQARLKASVKPSSLSINTRAGVLEVHAPAPGEPAQETSVQTKMQDGRLEVAVTEGKALLQPATAGQAPVEIKSLQRISASPKEVGKIEVFTPPIELLEPAEGATLRIDPNSANSQINLTWQNPMENSETLTYQVLIAADPEFKTVLLEQEVREPQLSLHFLDLGTLYWKVSTRAHDTRFESIARRLYVEKKSQH